MGGRFWPAIAAALLLAAGYWCLWLVAWPWLARHGY
jgi:hypothetical protein